MTEVPFTEARGGRSGRRVTDCMATGATKEEPALLISTERGRAAAAAGRASASFDCSVPHSSEEDGGGVDGEGTEEEEGVEGEGKDMPARATIVRRAGRTDGRTAQSVPVCPPVCEVR